jgi:hypothetical protein
MAVDLSGLGRARTAMPRNELRRGPAALPRIADVPIAPPQQIAILPEEDVLASAERFAEPLAEDTFAAVLDLATVAARYPILRNTL